MRLLAALETCALCLDQVCQKQDAARLSVVLVGREHPLGCSLSGDGAKKVAAILEVSSCSLVADRHVSRQQPWRRFQYFAELGLSGGKAVLRCCAQKEDIAIP